MKTKLMIKRVKLLILPLLFLSTIAMTCLKDNTPNCHYSLRMSNLSERDVFLCLIWTFPDDGRMHNINGSLTASDPFIPSKSIMDRLLHGSRCYENKAKEEYSIFRNDTILIGVVDRTIGETKTEREIVDQKLFLQLYYLSTDDLKKLDFTIYYPPISAMKEMKLVPEYREKRQE